MAIEERQLPGNQWEIKATGKDIKRTAGMLTPYANEKYREAFHKNEGIGFEKITDPSGKETAVRKDQLEDALAAGYGRIGLTPRMVMPEVPWEKKRLTPGKHKFRYDRNSGQIVEVS